MHYDQKLKPVPQPSPRAQAWGFGRMTTENKAADILITRNIETLEMMAQYRLYAMGGAVDLVHESTLRTELMERDGLTSNQANAAVRALEASTDEIERRAGGRHPADNWFRLISGGWGY